MTTLGLKVPALQRQMTNSRCRPYVVHRPHNWFACIQNLANTLQRQHALIDPVQMNDVCLPEFRQLRNIGSAVGYIHFKQVPPAEVQPCPYHQSFPQKTHLHASLCWQLSHCQPVCFFVTHQHLRFHTMVVQCLNQSSCRYRSTACSFTCIDYEYSHAAKVLNYYELRTSQTTFLKKRVTNKESFCTFVPNM